MEVRISIKTERKIHIISRNCVGKYRKRGVRYNKNSVVILQAYQKKFLKTQYSEE